MNIHNIDRLIHPNSVSVLIGPNGSGKSRLLRSIADDCLLRGDEVIAIAPTIFDRFQRMRSGRMHFFGARQGRSAAVRVIRAALVRASAESPQVLKDLTRALAYASFDPVIGIGITNLDFARFDEATKELSEEQREELHSALRKWRNRSAGDGIVRLELERFSFRELDALSFAVIAMHDDLLWRGGVVSRIEYSFFRAGVPIPALEACSGELCFITTIAFIATQIRRSSIIAIDEPETSLHPTWQQNYVRTLLDLFSHYQPSIVISTHSPIIVSGGEAARGAMLVYEMNGGVPSLFSHERLSLEEMYDRLFGLITPRNHYLSQRAVAILNALNSGNWSLARVTQELESLEAKSYDESQKGVIAKLIEVARRLDTMKGGRGE